MAAIDAMYQVNRYGDIYRIPFWSSGLINTIEEWDRSWPTARQYDIMEEKSIQTFFDVLTPNGLQVRSNLGIMKRCPVLTEDPKGWWHWLSTMFIHGPGSIEAPNLRYMRSEKMWSEQLPLTIPCVIEAQDATWLVEKRKTDWIGSYSAIGRDPIPNVFNRWSWWWPLLPPLVDWLLMTRADVAWAGQMIDKRYQSDMVWFSEEEVATRNYPVLRPDLQLPNLMVGIVKQDIIVNNT